MDYHRSRTLVQCWIFTELMLSSKSVYAVLLASYECNSFKIYRIYYLIFLALQDMSRRRNWFYWLNMKYDINGHTSNILSFVVEHAVRSGHRWLEASPSSLHHELSGGIAHSPCQHNLKGLLDDRIVLFRVNITLFINLIETKVSLKESLKSHQDGWYDQIL